MEHGTRELGQLRRSRSRRLSVFAILPLVLLAACSSAAQPSNTQPPSPQPPSAQPPSAPASGPQTSGAEASAAAAPSLAGGQLHLGLLLPDLSNATINGAYKGVQAEATKIGNIKVTEGGASDSSQWLSACQAIVASGVDVIAYNTLDPAGTSSCLKKANQQNIPLVDLFTPVPGVTNGAFVTLDYLGNGKKIGEWMAGAVKADPGEIGVFLGSPSEVGGAKDWVKGFESAITANCTKCTIVEVQPNGFSADLGFKAALSMLQAHPKMKGLYALFDGLAEGAVTAAKQAGRSDLVIGSHNGSCAGLGDILAGTMGYDIYLLGEPFGTWMMDAAVTLHNGGTVKDEALSAGWPVTTDTAKAILAGTAPDPSGGALKTALAAAQAGCK